MTYSRYIILFALLVMMPSIVFADFREMRLAVIPSGYTLDNENVVFTPEGRTVAFAAQLKNKSGVMFGGRVGKLYDHLRHISISPDGRSVAHNGTVIPTDCDSILEYLVVNGIETGPFQQVCNPIFSPDSRMVVFEVKNDGKWRHAVSTVDSDGIAAETGKADLHWMKPVFSPDGRLIVSIQQHRDTRKNVRLVSTTELREVSRKEYDTITDIVYSADGLRTAYAARKGEKEFVVTSSFAGGDEREGAAYDEVNHPGISPGGTHVAYGAERSGRRFLVIDEREIPAPFFYDYFPPVFSRDGRSVAYAAMRDGKPFIVAAGRESSTFDDVSIPVLNHDGSVLAFGALKNGKWRLIVNGNEGQAYDAVDSVQFAPDGKHVAFRGAKGGRHSMVISDLQGTVVSEGPLVEEIWQPAFDETGRLGYGALVGSELWWKVLSID